MARKKKVVEKQPPKRPKEWLTEEIAKEYKEKLNSYGTFTGFTGRTRELMQELMNRCGVTELEACNIMRGFNVGDYVTKYSILRKEYEEYYETMAG